MYILMHHLAGPGLPMMKLLGATPIYPKKIMWMLETDESPIILSKLTK